MYAGKIIRIDRRFGFILPHGRRGRDAHVFFHSSEVIGAEFGDALLNLEVVYELGTDRDGRRAAKKVRMAEQEIQA